MWSRCRRRRGRFWSGRRFRLEAGLPCLTEKIGKARNGPPKGRNRTGSTVRKVVSRAPADLPEASLPGCWVRSRRQGRVNLRSSASARPTHLNGRHRPVHCTPHGFSEAAIRARCKTSKAKSVRISLQISHADPPISTYITCNNNRHFCIQGCAIRVVSSFYAIKTKMFKNFSCFPWSEVKADFIGISNCYDPRRHGLFAAS